MRKVFSVTGLDCANCAAKMEAAIRKLDGVEYVRVSFITQKIAVEAEEEVFPALSEEIRKTARKISPFCKVVW